MVHRILMQEHPNSKISKQMMIDKFYEISKSPVDDSKIKSIEELMITHRQNFSTNGELKFLKMEIDEVASSSNTKDINTTFDETNMKSSQEELKQMTKVKDYLEVSILELEKDGLRKKLELWDVIKRKVESDNT
eukprot:TRINITY_DN5151_c0_g1_i10.p2 TRINITY_DN5151_c0_g1~~TRINITY_DN5151_c0_g1_i10.p2  ORF type:complete len:134 (+),score=32.01 TRINITY_DN5151_c0_g1_i10:188-589(+)